MITPGRGIKLVSQTVINGQLAGDLPHIARVQAVGRHADRGGIQILEILAHGLGQAEQEIRPGVIDAGRRTAVERGHAAGKIEAAAGSEGSLGLKMIDVVLGVLKAEAQRMRPFHPAHVIAGNVLIVAEQERIGDVGISETGKAGDRESRIAALQGVRPVRAGDMQHVQSVILVDIHVLRAKTKPRIADHSVEQQVGGEGVRSADAGALNAAGGASRLAAIGGVAARRAE